MVIVTTSELHDIVNKSKKRMHISKHEKNFTADFPILGIPKT